MKPRIKLSNCYRMRPDEYYWAKYVCRGVARVDRPEAMGFGATMREAYAEWHGLAKGGMMDPH